MQAPQISQYSSPMQMPECAVESSAGAPSHGPPKQHGAAVSVGDWNSNNQQVPNLANGATDKAVSGNGGCLPSQGLSANDQSTSARDDGAPQPSKGDKERRKKNYDPDVFFKVNGKLYQKLGKIGPGGSSEVHKVISAECTIYALKKIKLRGRDYPTAYGFCQEIEYLNKLKGKSNIIQLIDYELMDVNESPVYLLLNPAINHSQKDLPVTIYESELHVINGSPQLIFVRSNYTIETVEAERISVDHVAHLKPSDGSSAATQLAAHLTGIHSAIKMLNSRVHVIHQYLVAMQRGDIPLDNSLLRQVSSLVRRLPAMESEKFQDDFLMEYNDTLLMTYLAMFTNCSSTMNELVEKFNTTYERSTARRGGRGAFM